MGYLILRLGFGLIMAIQHGWPKLQKFSVLSTKFPDPLGVGSAASLSMTIFAELVCGVLIAVGLFTRLSSAVLIICMAVAAFVVHGGDPFAKKEMAILYLVAYVGIFVLGAGAYNVQNKIIKDTGIWLLK